MQEIPALARMPQARDAALVEGLNMMARNARASKAGRGAWRSPHLTKPTLSSS